MSASSARSPPRPEPPGREVGGDDFEEVTLVDIVRALHRRRAILAIILVLALAGGAALTVLATPQYEARAQIIALEQIPITRNWLASRQAAEFAVDAVGDRLYAPLYPDEWDATAGRWLGTEPTRAATAQRLMGAVTVTGGTVTPTLNPVIVVSVRMSDAAVARDVAQAYIESLAALRPELENITRSALFDRYYDGTNAQEAQARAERAAAEKSYWIVFDDPTVPTSPVRPRPVLNMALATVLGVMAGVMVVFGLEWLSKYRAEVSRVEPPRP